ncbi:MAG: CpsB/CapC family capsule biosynthesis tyrosine phosphatase [Cyclobacteriaceae bacterium]
MLGLFNRKKLPPLKVDLHSHLIPGIDDGCKTMEDTLSLLTRLSEAGIEKVYTTPHIAMEFYPNTPEIILSGLKEVRKAIEKHRINIKIEAAAEYYMDQHFLRMLKEDQPLLTLQDQYLLFETPFLNKPPFFDEVIFQMTAKGYIPIFAHPERYQYLGEEPDLLKSLKERKVLLQVNAGSLIGYYSKDIKKTAFKMLKNNMIDFLGSDIHNRRHLDAFISFRGTGDYQKVIKAGVLNDRLL